MKDFKNIIILDIKTTCWESKAPSQQPNEIIKLAVINYNTAEKKRTENDTFFIKPKFSEIGEYCKKIHNIKDENFNNAISFEEACKILENKFNTKNKTIFCYGSYPRTIFQKNCKLNEIYYPLSANNINLKNLLAVDKGLSSELKLEKVVEAFNLSKTQDSAWNILEIYKLIFEKE